MTVPPSGDAGGAGPTTADSADATQRALSLLDTAEQVARKSRQEALDEAQRIVAEAHREAERIREEARADAPELQRATEQLRVDRQRTLNAIGVLRDQLGSLLNAEEAGTPESES